MIELLIALPLTVAAFCITLLIILTIKGSTKRKPLGVQNVYMNSQTGELKLAIGLNSSLLMSERNDFELLGKL